MSSDVAGPAVVSFSGGRTSGLMMRRLLDSGLDADTHVLFANTGKEREETLDFVRNCAVTWGVNVVWLERPPGGGFTEVTYETASRLGEPFKALIDQRNYLPNPVTRFCTQELKIRVMRDWMRARGYDHWTMIVGMRADEPRRVARLRAGEGRDCWYYSFPLYNDGVTKVDVDNFWKCQPFGLGLQSWEGNCDLCFLKGRAKRERIIRDRPDLAAWWAEAEAKERTSKASGATFRNDTPPYKSLVVLASRPMLFGDAEMDGPDDLEDCLCGA